MKLKAILVLCTGLSCAAYVFSGSVNVMLVDNRENPINNATFFFKLKDPSFTNTPFQRGPIQVETIGKPVRMGNYYSPFNYRLFYSGQPHEVKVVAPGYKPYVWTQSWPKGNRGAGEFITVTLAKPNQHETDGDVDKAPENWKNDTEIHFLHGGPYYLDTVESIADSMREKGYRVLSRNIRIADVRRSEIVYHPSKEKEAYSLRYEIASLAKYKLKPNTNFPKNKITILVYE